MTLKEKHIIELALRNSNIQLVPSNPSKLLDIEKYNIEQTIKQNNNALDVLSRIEITEPKPHIEEVIDLTAEIKNNSNLEFKEDELYLIDVQKNA